MIFKGSDIPRAVVILIIGGFIQSIGNSLMWPLNSLFMHNVLGRTLTEAGSLLALQSAASLLGQFLSGFLADRFGYKKMMLIGLIGAVSSVGSIGCFPVWRVYMPGFILFGLAQAFIFVPLNALLHAVWPEGGRRGFNLLYVSNNAGVAIGTAIGGLIAQVSFRLTFSLNALAFLIYFLLVSFGISEPKTSPSSASAKRSSLSLSKDPGFKVLLALGGGIFFVWGAYIQLVSILPVVMTQIGFSLFSYSILWTLNGVFIVTLQPLINWIIRTFAQSFQRQFYLSALLISIGFIIIWARLPYASYVIAILIITLGEMLILPGVPAASAQLAPSGKTGAYQGIVGGSSAGGRMIGPFLGGVIFDSGGGSHVWMLALFFMAASMVMFFLYGRLVRPLLASQIDELPSVP
ncbi:arabinose efflux permease family protein [Desulfosporosinus acidiphilus SJ4]|uniref:Arabinose efflux permease family protein n=1 Tax=Desulfosporosinus acidiphilus (strain DSM 22704 / JCM 16185 / SJ4) TaxID=646529 RepID=I4D0I3_DESAJ|nr:MFS transporter [Desulfosporosinus acidiphilus]AFM39307.1 arabinose efflux permease family protein [Desulfosporosinus acidiphilus SJ4]